MSRFINHTIYLYNMFHPLTESSSGTETLNFQSTGVSTQRPYSATSWRLFTPNFKAKNRRKVFLEFKRKMTSPSPFRGRCPPRRRTTKGRRPKIQRSIASSSTVWENSWRSWSPEFGRSRLEFWPYTRSRSPSEPFSPSTSQNSKVWKGLAVQPYFSFFNYFKFFCFVLVII